MARYTYDEGRVIYNKVNALLEQGLRVSEATKKAGISYGTYNNWKAGRYASVGGAVVPADAAIPMQYPIVASVKQDQTTEDSGKCFVIVTTVSNLPQVVAQL